MSIERRFDIPFIASMAVKEKQIQQNIRPIIAVHKWFARRPGTLFRALLLAEFIDRRLDETFFVGHDFEDKVVADPFMGGGGPLIEANRVGCDVLGFDINPMSTWIVREEIEHLDIHEYRAAAHRLITRVSELVGDVVESAIEDVLSKSGVSYRKTKRAERIAGFDQAPDFIIPDEFNPSVV